ncbi:MAG: M23 family metallopeptidase [Muribaculaceae bacterium]
MKIKDLTFVSSVLPRFGSRKGTARPLKTRRRWRVEIINENTLARVWSMRLSEFKAWIAGGALIAAIGSLIAVILIFTPIRSLLSGELPGDLRDRYTELALKLDSVSERARISEAYSANIVAILTDSVSEDDVRRRVETSVATTDSFITASEREKQFVQQFESRERFNLSVLSPIAAEGMIFEAPTATDAGTGNVCAIYRGTVIALDYGSNGLGVIAIQHPNDFISVYSNLSDTYVEKGAKILAGQRIGASTTDAPLLFELWHSGTLLDTPKYIKYPSVADD